MTDFRPFGVAVNNRLTQLSAHELFTTAAGDDVWAHYLASFPEGTNPIYKNRTEHDCSCCKNFVRNFGNVVAVVDGKVQSIWDIPDLGNEYSVVAAALNAFVIAAPITGLFRSSEVKYGAEKSRQVFEGGTSKNWDHFFGAVAPRHQSRSVDKDRGDYGTTAQVFKRGLEELTAESFSTVIDLIKSNALYRGEEHLASLQAFQKVQNAYKKLKSDAGRNTFVWANATSPASRFRNTVIGTLIQDLSAGVDLESAVRSFETKVAPTNYKRPTALITPRMVQDAMKTIAELDLESALSRRYAKLSDVSVNNVLWVDNTVQGKMKGGVEGLLMDAATKQIPEKGKAEEITIDDFMSNVLPTVSSIDVLIQGIHLTNFMSLTAPVHPDSGKLFKWGNDFGWSYDGNITDSIKEKVKNAGGNVTNAKMRVSLAWYNFDDLDIHIYEPNGTHIYYCNKAGKLDVDMNAGCGRSREPVENVSWTTVQDGDYKVVVNQFSRRETSDVGFTVEIENGGQLCQLSYPKAAVGMVDVATLTVKGGMIAKITTAKDVVNGGGISQDKWGVKTETYAKVNTLMKSPNHWDGNEVGNKHWFFVLDGCANPDSTRGIYNEFLNSNLEKHRKVFEVLGDKTKCPYTEDQLSGLGFSSTRGDTVTVKVAGKKLQKTFNIKF